MTTVSRPVPAGTADRLATALPLGTGDALAVLYGPGTKDWFCCGDYQERGFSAAIWALLRSAGYRRIVYCTLNGLYFLDEESHELDRGRTVAPQQRAGAPAMKFFSGPRGDEDMTPADPAPAAGGSALMMQDPQIIQKLDACMTGREVPTAVVLLRTEDFLRLNLAPRALVDRIGSWIEDGPSAKNLCVLAFSNSELPAVQESVQTYGGIGALHAFLSDQQRRRTGGGIGRVGPPDEAELTRLVHRTRIRHGLRIADWAGLPNLLAAMAAVNLPVTSWIARLKQLVDEAVPLSAGDLRERGWIDTATTDNRPALERLHELTGLHEVKEHFARLADRVRVDRIRKIKRTDPPSPHLIFTGNPGTGKTTVARLVGEIYRDLGLLSRGHVVVADAPKLVGEFVGQTAPLVNATVDKAMDGVLFIDEAYRLTEADRGGFGMEAIDTLVDRMENDRDRFVVISAGYPGKMMSFRAANPGLPGRFPERNVIEFADYRPAELLQILTGLLQGLGLRWDDDFAADLARVTEGLYRNRDANFSNARAMRELAAEIDEVWVRRVLDDPDVPLERRDLPTRLQEYLR